MTDPRHPAAAAPQTLARLMRQAAAELQQQSPPPWATTVQRLGRVAPLAPARPASPRWRWRWPLALSAALSMTVLAGGAGWLLLPLLVPPAEDSRAAAGFMPVVPAERWLRLAEAGAPPAWVVTADVPRARLAGLGLPFDPARAAEPVRAELLMNPAGEVLAVRLAQPAPHLPKRSDR